MLDHLVFAVPDLTAAVALVVAATGVEAVPGGRHVGLGTANWLIGLGPGSYLEIIGPDPGQPDPAGPRPFGIDELRRPRLVTWAIRVPDLDAAVAQARRSGYDPGDPREMSRRTPDGELLHWRLTPDRRVGAVGILPFLIDWGDSRHPSAGGLPPAELEAFAGHTADLRRDGADLAALGAELPLEPGPERRLVARLRGPRGTLTLD